MAGTEQVAAAVGACLLEPELCEYAAQALSTCGGAKSAAALRKALPQAKGNVKASIIRGLGCVRDAGSVDALLKALGDSERETRITAGFALAEIAVGRSSPGAPRERHYIG